MYIFNVEKFLYEIEKSVMENSCKDFDAEFGYLLQ